MLFFLQISKGRVLIPWNKSQKRFAEIYFSRHLQLRIPPKKKECEELKELHPDVFANKTWAQIKIFIVNIYKKK